VPTVSNVRQDLNEWQARHATLVLSAVKVLFPLSISASGCLIFDACISMGDWGSVARSIE
jgi:hypothetical protein